MWALSPPATSKTPGWTRGHASGSASGSHSRLSLQAHQWPAFAARGRLVREPARQALDEIARLSKLRHYPPVSWLDEDGVPVVAELVDRFLDVGERAVRLGLLRHRVPACIPFRDEHFDRADVDDPVVQIGVQPGHVPGDEPLVVAVVV